MILGEGENMEWAQWLPPVFCMEAIWGYGAERENLNGTQVVLLSWERDNWVGGGR